MSGSVPRGSSSPAFGPLVMTMRETVAVVAAPPCGLADAGGRGGATRGGRRRRARGAGAGRGAAGGFRHPSHLHAEQVGAQRIDDREDEEPQQQQEADAQQEEGQLTHRSGPPPCTSNARVDIRRHRRLRAARACATTRKTMSVRPIVIVESGVECGLDDLAGR